MKAGRALDALIAEKVFGEQNPPKKVSGASEWSAWRLTAEYVPRWTPKAFSTQIDDAWPVVEKLGLSVVKHDDGTNWLAGKMRWEGHEGFQFDGNQELADTAPLAICLAALKAVE